MSLSGATLSHMIFYGFIRPGGSVVGFIYKPLYHALAVNIVQTSA